MVLDIERLVEEGAHVVAADVCEVRLEELKTALGDAVTTVAGVMDGFLPTAELDDETQPRRRAGHDRRRHRPP